MPVTTRSRTLVATFAVAGMLTTPFTAAATRATAPVARASAPVPVQADPGVTESSPSSYGMWFGWAQNSRANPEHVDYFVRHGSQPRIKVNAPGTQAPSGSVLKDSVIYAQQRGTATARLFRFDRRTKKRNALPPVVYRAKTPRGPGSLYGGVSADGPWVSFVRRIATSDVPYYQVVLYHRVSRKVRVISSVPGDLFFSLAGQVNYPFATYQTYGRDGETEVVRYDIRTGTKISVEERSGDEAPTSFHDPAVASDGTFYYWRYKAAPSEPGEPIHVTDDLIRRMPGTGEEVVLSLSDPVGGPGGTFVKGRPDGGRFVFYGLDGDVYRILDR